MSLSSDKAGEGGSGIEICLSVVNLRGDWGGDSKLAETAAPEIKRV